MLKGNEDLKDIRGFLKKSMNGSSISGVSVDDVVLSLDALYSGEEVAERRKEDLFCMLKNIAAMFYKSNISGFILSDAIERVLKEF